MRFDVITLFPELFSSFLTTSIVGRAVTSGAVEVHRKSPREFGIGRHRSVDDTPYGGGSGMVMRVDCIVECLESLTADEGAGALDPVTMGGSRAAPRPRERQKKAIKVAMKSEKSAFIGVL